MKASLFLAVLIPFECFAREHVNSKSFIFFILYLFTI